MVIEQKSDDKNFCRNGRKILVQKYFRNAIPEEEFEKWKDCSEKEISNKILSFIMPFRLINLN